jgi:hypothetical protein
VHIVNPSGIGAVSLILDFREDLAEVVNVTMDGAGGQLDWTVKGHELRIGWNSPVPLTLDADDELLSIRLKAKPAFTNEALLQFTLASNPLNELADQWYNVIENATLSTEVVSAGALGTNDQQEPATGLLLTNHPNPYTDYTVISYSLPFDGKVTLEIRNVVGQLVKTLLSDMEARGEHDLRLEASGLGPGIYTVTIILDNNDHKIARTIKIICIR